MTNSDRAEMNDIIQFLGLRADRDERIAKAVRHEDYWLDVNGWAEIASEATEHAHRHDPKRVLAEVEVIRQVINDYRASDGAILRADNPDFDDPAWRGIYAGRDAFKSVLRAYAKASGWKASEFPHPERSETAP